MNLDEYINLTGGANVQLQHDKVKLEKNTSRTWDNSYTKKQLPILHEVRKAKNWKPE